MKYKSLFIFLWIICFGMFAYGQNAPQTIFLNGENLLKNRKTLATDPSLKTVYAKADSIIKKAKFYSVMNKEQLPPSGNKHDYMSQAPYWWADPAKPNGLPYIRRDGERNPELNKISDGLEKEALIQESEIIALAYFFSGNEKYAEHSAKLIKTWFIDEKTRQNPNLNFAQGIPGINTGRGIGLIETREFYRIIDASILLEGSKYWTSTDKKALKTWFGDFLKWMLESDLGKDEAGERNNHGTYYDVQIISLAIFSKNQEIARKQIEVTKKRIKSQFEKDGSQPHELARTLSWNYVNMNLYGFFIIARLAENLNIDLWNFQTNDGKSLKKGFDWLIPYIKNEKNWTHQQIKPRTFELTIKLLNLAATRYKNPEFAKLAKTIDTKDFQSSLERILN